MNDYWQEERQWRRRDINEKQKPLSVTLKKYSLTIAAVSMLSHLILDGIISVSLLSALMFTYVLSYRKARVNVNETYYDLRRNYYKTCILIFSSTFLAILRVAFISLSDESRFSLYLAYLALFLAFTENLQMMSEAESYTPPPPPPVHVRRIARYAPAG
uniref:Serpentine receptor class gamma n=2 Tax=Caenorhabditis tropicalis TaxID=1561998 RepID=A0A1I7TVA4_9PELO